MNRILLLLSLAIFCHSSVHCQDSVLAGFGRVLPEDFHPSSPVIDSSAEVVVLSDVGDAELVGDAFFGWRVKYTRYRKMLIRNKEGVKAAKVELSFDPFK